MELSVIHSTHTRNHKTALTFAVASILMLTGILQAQLITGVSSNTGAGKAVHGGILAEASPAMTDRGHVYRQIPAFLAGQAEYIKTANDDKNSTTYRLTFTLTADADVYLFIDTRVNMDTSMAWVRTAGAVDTGSQVGLDEGNNGSIDRWCKVYKKFCTAGTYTLSEQAAGDYNMYGVAAAVPGTSVFAISVDAQANRRPISPYIYGVGGPKKNPHIAELNFVIDRMGGEVETAYNWKQNAHNLCKNWYWISMGDGVPAGMYDDFFETRRLVGAESALTITTSPWVAKLGPANKSLCSFSIAKYGPQTGYEPYGFPDAGNGIISEDPKVYVTGNDPNDAYMQVDSLYQKEFVEHLIAKFGLSTEGGVTNYIMDNEPFLWSSTHRDLYPGGITVKDVGDYTIDYAGRIRFLDPHAIIWGPELFNFWVFDKIPPLLQQLKEYEDKTGLRVLDVLTVHYYPSPCDNDITEAGQLHRNAATRTLWDPTYKDPRNNNMILNVIPRLQGWVDQYYPGLKTGITEWNWGAEDHISGATALADSYGIMGREGLDVATHWGNAPDDPARPTFKAMKMYRNYDGNKSTFGDISVSTQVLNPDLVSAFAAERTSDRALTLMVINKQLDTDETPTIALANFIHGSTAQVWQLTAANVITRLADIPVTEGQLAATLPRQSITLFVIPNGAPVTTGPASNPGPANFAANVSTKPTLTWTAGTDAFSHSVYLGTSTSAVAAATPDSPEYQGTFSTTGYIPATLSGSTTYYWRVDAQANGDPAAGPVWQFTTGVPPAAPTGLSASQVFDRDARLAWNPAAQATSYNLKRSTRPEGPFVPIATTSAAFFTDNTMAAGLTYYFVVSSVNASGEGPGSAPIAVTTRVNFARGKTASASSVSGGNTAAKAVDGATNSRWESEYADPQWIQVDLGSALVLDTYRIRWENAYSRAFQLQVSNNGTDWTTIYSTTANPGGVQVLNLAPVSARFVRIYGTQRSTTWGHSLWELEIFGTGNLLAEPANRPFPADGAAGVITNKDLSWFAGKDAFMYRLYLGTDSAAVAAAGPAWPEYKGTFAFRDYKPVDLDAYTAYYWRVDALNSTGDVTAGPVWTFTTGSHGADVNGDGAPNMTDLLYMANQWLNVKQPRQSLRADLNNDGIVNLRDFARLASGWLALQEPPTGLSVWNITSTEALLTWDWVPGAASYKLKRGTSPTGPFTTIATTTTKFFHTDNTLSDGTTYYYVVSCVNANGEGPNSAPLTVGTPANLAKFKPVTVSSVRSPNTGAKAVDGNTGSRWESQFSDPQHIQIDLQAVQTISSCRLRWEYAAAKTFTIQVSANGTAWETVYSTTNGPGGTQLITFSPVAARYVKMVGTERKTVYGYSLYEFEIYN
jgi:fibronectin type 3 domain-containing protein